MRKWTQDLHFSALPAGVYLLEVSAWDNHNHQTSGFSPTDLYADQFVVQVTAPRGAWYTIWHQLSLHDATGQNAQLMADILNLYPWLQRPAQTTLFDHPVHNTMLESIAINATVGANEDDVKKWCYPVLDMEGGAMETSRFHGNSPHWALPANQIATTNLNDDTRGRQRCYQRRRL